MYITAIRYLTFRHFPKFPSCPFPGDSPSPRSRPRGRASRAQVSSGVTEGSCSLYVWAVPCPLRDAADLSGGDAPLYLDSNKLGFVCSLGSTGNAWEPAFHTRRHLSQALVPPGLFDLLMPAVLFSCSGISPGRFLGEGTATVTGCHLHVAFLPLA